MTAVSLKNYQLPVEDSPSFFRGKMTSCKSFLNENLNYEVIISLQSIYNFPVTLRDTIQKTIEWYNTFFEGISRKLGSISFDVILGSLKIISTFARAGKLASRVGLVALSSRYSDFLNRMSALYYLFFGLSSIRSIWNHSTNLACRDKYSATFQYSLLQVSLNISLLPLFYFQGLGLVSGDPVNPILLKRLRYSVMGFQALTRSYGYVYRDFLKEEYYQSQKKNDA